MFFQQVGPIVLHCSSGCVFFPVVVQRVVLKFEF